MTLLITYFLDNILFNAKLQHVVLMDNNLPSLLASTSNQLSTGWIQPR